MPTITKFLEFDAGHRLVNHEGKCARLHGHRYKVGITIKTRVLDKIGRAVDFGVVKQVVGGWIDENWDHNMLLNSDDPLLKMCAIMDAQERQRSRAIAECAPHSCSNLIFGGKTPYIFRGRNPTAEVIGEELLGISIQLLQKHMQETGGQVFKIRVWETPTCNADIFAREHFPDLT
jgi:6-pyruvoyl tetrahydropterin synthase/QueD family protein